MLAMVGGLCYDNWGTLVAMADSRKRSRYAAGDEHSNLKTS
jgi:hypothetical protein